MEANTVSFPIGDTKAIADTKAANQRVVRFPSGVATADPSNVLKASAALVGMAMIAMTDSEGVLVRLSVSTVPATQTKMILIAGPYRSGTNDDPELLAQNVRFMETFALPIFRAGHIPIVGEWLALPLVQLAGSQHVGDGPFNEIFHPIAIRLLERCDGILRVGGPSAGADEMVRVGRQLGLSVYAAVNDIPGCSEANAASSA
jgi:hypothetical protein